MLAQNTVLYRKKKKLAEKTNQLKKFLNFVSNRQHIAAFLTWSTAEKAALMKGTP